VVFCRYILKWPLTLLRKNGKVSTFNTMMETSIRTYGLLGSDEAASNAVNRGGTTRVNLSSAQRRGFFSPIYITIIILER